MNNSVRSPTGRRLQAGCHRGQYCLLYTRQTVLGRIWQINDLPEVIDPNSRCYMLADDTKLFRETKSHTDKHMVQCDIDDMHGWSEEWLMSYHPGKFNVLKLGK